MRWALLVLMVLFGGCAGMREEYRQSVGAVAGCPDVQLSDPDGFGGITAKGCEREWRCQANENHQPTCIENQASHQATIKKIVIDRLALDTGCPADKIKIVSESQWVQGTEQAFRLTACDKFYICTTATNRTECKVALGQAQPVQPTQPTLPDKPNQ